MRASIIFSSPCFPPSSSDVEGGGSGRDGRRQEGPGSAGEGDGRRGWLWGKGMGGDRRSPGSAEEGGGDDCEVGGVLSR